MNTPYKMYKYLNVKGHKVSKAAHQLFLMIIFVLIVLYIKVTILNKIKQRQKNLMELKLFGKELKRPPGQTQPRAQLG